MTRAEGPRSLLGAHDGEVDDAQTGRKDEDDVAGKQVGAVTDRTRAMFEEEGIRVFEDMSVLEAMEDAETGDLDAAEAAE